MQYDNALKYIYSRELFGIKLGLKNITELMNELNNPQNSYKSIHIAGTNGKGSTCAILSSILQQQGYKVGVYTSPHLVDFRERIKVNGEKIPKKEVIKLLSKLKPLIKDHTFFEVVTSLAFLYFKQQKVDFAIFEVGMGGRLDATNIIKPEISVITNISLEHTEHLGSTINKIAFEKSGIIKEKTPLIVSKDCKGLKVIKKIAKKNKSKIYLVKTKKVDSALKGSFQNQNASLALGVIKLLSKKYKISKENVKKGLETVKWPGRFEYISKNVIFDCAHNPEGAKTLAKELKNYKNVYIILGIMKDKDIKHIVNALEKVAKEIIVTRPHISRAAMPDSITKFIHKKVTVINKIDDALEYAKLKSGKNMIILTGSIFTVGEAFEKLHKDPFEK